MDELQWNLYSAEQLRELDRLAWQAPGSGSLVLMERAGRCAYALLRERWPSARRLVVLCGGGSNAGDGYVLARLAHDDGLVVDVMSLVDPERLKGDARQVAERFTQTSGHIHGFEPARLDEVDVIVDAMFGIGLDREVGGDWRRAIEAANASPARVLAVDLPSGLAADTGAVLGEAVRADVTATFIGLKKGLYTGSAAAYRGEVRLYDLQVPADVYAHVPPSARLIAPAAVAACLPRRSADAHKGAYGHVLVIGGDLGMGGAARMAAEAALRVGAGLVSVATRAQHVPALLAARPEAMAVAVETPADLDEVLNRVGVVVVGPGLGRDAWGRGALQRLEHFEGGLVLDADALNVLAELGWRRANWVLTPHPGEAGRLLQRSAVQVQANRYAAAAEISRRYGGVTVLKGSGTIVQEPDGAAHVCAAGNPGMASGGMGDVLAGVIGGLLAQGESAPRAAFIGVHVHAAAADKAATAGQRGMLASDLMHYLRQQVNPQ